MNDCVSNCLLNSYLIQLVASKWIEILTVLSFFLAVATLFEFKINYIKDWLGTKVISEKQVKRLSKSLVDKFNADQLSIDCIVCFPDGGLSFADAICFAANKRYKVLSLLVERVASTHGHASYSVTSNLSSVAFSGNGQILVVDDALRSGSSINVVIEFLVKEGVSKDRIRVAVLAKLEGVNSFVTYWDGCKYTNTVRFPWGGVPV